MLIKASNKGYIIGLLSCLYPKGVLSLQYANDTLLFLKHDYMSALNGLWSALRNSLE
jgi:hypothetical protein